MDIIREVPELSAKYIPVLPVENEWPSARKSMEIENGRSVFTEPYSDKNGCHKYLGNEGEPCCWALNLSIERNFFAQLLKTNCLQRLEFF